MTPARLFVNRMLAFLRSMPDRQAMALSDAFHQDLNWFRTSLEKFNGVMAFQAALDIAAHILVDASLFALGGVCQGAAYHLPLPDTLKGDNIAFLELLNVLVALKLWGPQFAGSKVCIHCDNMAAVQALMHYKIICPKLATVTRNI